MKSTNFQKLMKAFSLLVEQLHQFKIHNLKCGTVKIKGISRDCHHHRLVVSIFFFFFFFFFSFPLSKKKNEQTEWPGSQPEKDQPSQEKGDMPGSYMTKICHSSFFSLFSFIEKD